jgi:phosphomannomutase
LRGELIVSASGIRGIVDHGLDADTARRYGAAYGEYLLELSGSSRSGRVLLGRDSRTSGAALADAVAAGLTGAGWDVGDLGIVPTPTALLAVQEDERAWGGVVVTASHNPAQWNGLKLASGAGEFIEPAGGREVQARFEDSATRNEPSDAESGQAAGRPVRGRRQDVAGALDRHLEGILALPLLIPGIIGERRLRVALDCVRGAGGLILPALLERLGSEVVGINLEPDGRFPRDPEPTTANLDELARLVRETDADLGMAVDPDVDRLALVDERGVPVGEDWTLALAVELVLAKRSGPVVTNLSSSQCIEDAAVRGGEALFRAPVGEANVAQLMAEVGAAIGGEGNGGVILPDLHATRDAPLAAALILQLLSERNESLGELIGALPSYAVVKHKAPRPKAPLDVVYGRLESEARRDSEVDRQDGLRLSWPARREWLHVRPSGTEPIVRVIAEAPEIGAAESLSGWAIRLLSMVEEPGHGVGEQ